MPIFATYLRRLYVALAELTWTALALLGVAHVALSWVLFALAGEAGIVGEPVDFIYYYLVTATTVGYGDFSPGTKLGRLFAALFVLPGGIAIFTATLGKVLTAIAGLWRQRMNGLGSFSDRSGHMVVVGWDGAQTRRLLEMLAAERAPGEPAAVVVAKDLETNPMPDEADYVRAERLVDPTALERAGAKGARTVIVRGHDDDQTLAAALVAAEVVGGGHIVAHFQDERTAAILRRQNPAIESIGSLSSEMLVRAARDPGASVVANLLFTASTADTAYSVRVPALDRPLTYGEALAGLKRLHQATLVGLAHDGRVDLNCDDATPIEAGNLLYYIADHRIGADDVAWDRLATSSASA